MTPFDLLNDIKKRFPTLLHREDENLIPLLRQALVAYQDKAGATRTYFVQRNDIVNYSFDAPTDVLKRIKCKGFAGGFVRHDFDGGKVTLNANDLRGIQYPLKFTYFINLRTVDIDTYELPELSIGLISDYLYVLIQIPNSERLRRIGVAGGIDTSDIPTEDALQSRKAEIEAAMKSTRSVFSAIAL